MRDTETPAEMDGFLADAGAFGARGISAHWSQVDQALAERPPASWKLYTIGDPLSAKTKYPFWLDD